MTLHPFPGRDRVSNKIHTYARRLDAEISKPVWQQLFPDQFSRRPACPDKQASNAEITQSRNELNKLLAEIRSDLTAREWADCDPETQDLFRDRFTRANYFVAYLDKYGGRG